MKFIVERVYAEQQIYAFDVADFVLGIRLWTPRHVAAIVGALAFNDYFGAVSLDNCPHLDNPIVVRALCDLLQHNSTLHTASFRHTGLTPEGLHALAEALQQVISINFFSS